MSFPRVSLALWAPHLEHHLLPLYLRKGRTLYGRHFQNQASQTKTRCINSSTGKRKKNVFLTLGWTVPLICYWWQTIKKCATVWLDAGRKKKKQAALTAGREHLSSWHCGYIPSQDASLARERSGLTERPTGKCWRLAPVETQDYMRPYSTLCARAPVYLSPLGFSSMWQDFFSCSL